MKDGEFEITLVSPGSPELASKYRAELDAVSDRWEYWDIETQGRLFPVTRMRHVFASEPIPVASDRSSAGASLVARELARQPDIVVLDFPHCAVLVPERIDVPSVVFTHNVEAEIFRRHIDVAWNPFIRQLWRSQTRKMEEFEGRTLARFDAVVAVAERDARAFADHYGIEDARVISTGVDLEFFDFKPPAPAGCALFLGSMDWLANIDAMNWLMDDIWPLICAAKPDARLKIVGRNPPDALVNRAKSRRLNWEFTGFVEDVRDHVGDVAAFIIPLRVGGGTRIKVFEAMAMGMPVISTSIGVEGLPLVEDEHYLCADDAESFARMTFDVMSNDDLGRKLSATANGFVRENFSSVRAAREFEQICVSVLDGGADSARQAREIG
ncbi:MAG: glycosyltransferase family 4 protein [Gammaproteobacteria bacterium]|nr:glycosyltransferase family 4 protein [Gammaproteobacteria bacterium]